MIEGMSLSEACLAALLVIGISTCIISVLCVAGERFIALRSPPKTRARWTVGLAYGGAVIALLAWMSEIAPWWLLPLAPIIPAGIGYAVLLSSYKKAWVDDANDLPEGVSFANDDWRFGICLLLGAIAAAAIRVAFRSL